MPTKTTRVMFAGLVLVSLVLAAIACNTPSRSQGTPTQSASGPTFFIDPTLLTPGTTVSGPTDTPQPQPTPTHTVVCAYWGAYYDDVTIPDGTQIAAGSTFVKTWKLWNNGCLDWTVGTQLVRVRGDAMGDNDVADVEPTVANGIVEVSVTLTAPTTPGEYTSYWRLRAPNGEIFGEEIYVQIEVIAVNTPTPTVTSTATPAYAPFVARWRNQDEEGRITWVDITAAGDTITVHLWQACAPTNCDLGAGTTTTQDAADSVLSVRVTREAATETMQIAILIDGRLQIVGSVESSSGVQRYTSYFRREAAQ